MTKSQFSRASAIGVEHHPPGTGAQDPLPGDFILTHGSEFISQLIRLGQQLRFGGADNKFTYWNHAALVVSDDGAIIEALGAGVRRNTLANYELTQYTLVRIVASAEDRAEAAAFAQWCLDLKYGWTTILSIVLSLLTGARFSFGFNGQMICSGLVARALERTTAIFEQEPSHILPAELAKIYGAEPPPAESPKGQRARRVRSAASASTP